MAYKKHKIVTVTFPADTISDCLGCMYFDEEQHKDDRDSCKKIPHNCELDVDYTTNRAEIYVRSLEILKEL